MLPVWVTARESLGVGRSEIGLNKRCVLSNIVVKFSGRNVVIFIVNYGSK